MQAVVDHEPFPVPTAEARPDEPDDGTTERDDDDAGGDEQGMPAFEDEDGDVYTDEDP